ncbi:MAG: radical SAM family heme chaperone HemW [bacterium]|nr:radical SAM family heme chaperone HemW [bacterium]
MSELVDAAALERSGYVHIPFCHRRCPYCDFAVVDLENDEGPIQRYVAAVVAEIQMEEPWDQLHSVNFGGGTPSVLDSKQIDAILRALRNRFGIAPGAEISLEANPEDITRDYAGALRDVGVNRVSLGVQSFDDDVLRSLGRSHTAAQASEAVANAHTAGIETVSLDLILGTPGETLQSWRETVATALELQTEHLSAYALTVELGTELSRRVHDGAAGPDDDDQADKYEMLAELAAPRLHHYEVSNWAAQGQECRYNQTTWAQGEYLAFGLGAHGHRNRTRRRNTRRLDVYLDQVESGTRPEIGSERLNDWERERERVFLGLRRRSGVVAGQAGAVLMASVAGRRFAEAGVVTLVGDRLIVNKPLLTDAVAREVLGLESP